MKEFTWILSNELYITLDSDDYSRAMCVWAAFAGVVPTNSPRNVHADVSNDF